MAEKADAASTNSSNTRTRTANGSFHTPPAGHVHGSIRLGFNVALWDRDAQSKANLERQLQRSKESLTHVRWKAVLSPVRFDVKAARWMHAWFH